MEKNTAIWVTVIGVLVIIIAFFVWDAYFRNKTKTNGMASMVPPANGGSTGALSAYDQCIKNYIPGIVSAEQQCGHLKPRPTPSNAWDTTKAYVAGDIVTYQGASYKNLVAITGIPPTNTNYWVKL